MVQADLQPYTMMTQSVLPTTTAPIVAMASSSTRGEKHKHYRHQCVLGLSVTQLVIGVLCYLFQIILMCTRSPNYVVGLGFWTGTFFIICGSLGIASSKKKTTSLIVAFLVFAILSAVLTVCLLAMSVSEVAISDSMYVQMDSLGRIPSDYLEKVEDATWDGDKNPKDSEIYRRHYYEPEFSVLTVIIVSSMMIILAVLQCIVGTVSSAYACHGLCGGSRNSNTMLVAGQVQYFVGPGGEQQVVIVPLAHQAAALNATAIAPGGSYTAVYPSHMLPGPSVAQPPQYSGQEPPPPAYDEHTVNEKKFPIPQ